MALEFPGLRVKSLPEESGWRRSLVFFIVNCTSHGPDWMAVQESCVGDDRLERDFLPFAIDMQRDNLGGQCGNLFRGKLVSIFSATSSSGLCGWSGAWKSAVSRRNRAGCLY